jgi:hypothetical protein
MLEGEMRKNLPKSLYDGHFRDIKKLQEEAMLSCY